jgi:hypothetical protein
MMGSQQTSKEIPQDGEPICIPKTQFADIIHSFLHDMSFKMPDIEYDHQGMTGRLEEHFKAQQFSPQFIHRIQPILRWAAGIAVTTYPFVNCRTQEAIGIYTAYAITIDDFANQFKQDLKDFNRRTLSRQTHNNKLLQCFAEFLAATCPSFGQFGGDMIIKSSMEFVSACYFEAEEKELQLRFPSDAPDFPRFLRYKSGVPETYSFFAFPEDSFPEDRYLRYYLPSIPYVGDLFCYINDIFSFYKEFTMTGDSFNFIRHHALTHNVDVFQSLRELCNETVEIIRRIRTITAVDPQIHANVEQLIQGYVVYHLSQSRYKLSEIGITGADEANRRLK